MQKTLVVITGPTAVGKTQTSIEIARALGTEIISADARQFYKELKIGTAAPTPAEMSAVKHHLVGNISVHDYYNASIFETQALEVLDSIFHKSDFAIVTGGSGLYIDTLCYGIDKLPDAHPATRASIQKMLQQQGLHHLTQILHEKDPEYHNEVDLQNPNRVMRALEVILTTGQKFSELRSNSRKARPFAIKKIIINRPRPELFERINLRTGLMVQEGIVEEAIRFFPQRHLNALNTVGYKELFDWLENQWELKTAVEKIRIHTRRYAKRQLTWFKRYDDAKWFLPSETSQIIAYIKSKG